MRILVTGGTGFLGSHTVRALLEFGHEPVLLVRDAERVAPALEPLEVEADRCRIVEGDVLDEGTVEEAMTGVDALLHAANVYSLKPGQAERMRRVNVDGTRLVLHAAERRGLDPIVHVSSVVALLPSSLLTSRSPVGSPAGDYMASKAAAERIAREFQDEGAPVVITYPAAIVGPHDPHTGDTTAAYRDMIRPKARSSFAGGSGVVDVRDLAAAHARLFTPGAGPRRYLMGGHWRSCDDMYRLLAEAVGHRLPHVKVPVKVALAAGRLADVLHRRGIDPGFAWSNAWILANHPTFDDRDTQRDLGVEWRPTVDSFRDMVAWLHEQGQLSSRQAGAAADVDWRLGSLTRAQQR